jgi:hypothetical protein
MAAYRASINFVTHLKHLGSWRLCLQVQNEGARIEVSGCWERCAGQPTQ